MLLVLVYLMYEAKYNNTIKITTWPCNKMVLKMLTKEPVKIFLLSPAGGRVFCQEFCPCKILQQSISQSEKVPIRNFKYLGKIQHNSLI